MIQPRRRNHCPYISALQRVFRSWRGGLGPIGVAAIEARYGIGSVSQNDYLPQFRGCASNVESRIWNLDAATESAGQNINILAGQGG